MDEVLLDVRDSVAVLTLSGPESRNAVTAKMNRQISAACRTINEDHTIGAAIVRGADGTFCAGSNRGEWSGSRRDPAEAEAFERSTVVYQMLLDVGGLEVPTVAAVRGAAVGGGFNLALACDVRVVSMTARLVGGFLSNGLHPGGGFFALLGRSAGREVAAAVGLFGVDVMGVDAVRLGLALESVDDGEVEDRAWVLASRAARDPELSRMCTSSYRAQLGPPPVPWAVAVEADRGRQMWSHRRRESASADRGKSSQ